MTWFPALVLARRSRPPMALKSSRPQDLRNRLCFLLCLRLLRGSESKMRGEGVSGALAALHSGLLCPGGL